MDFKSWVEMVAGCVRVKPKTTASANAPAIIEPAKIGPAIFNVQIDPPEAKLIVPNNLGTVAGEGRERKIQIIRIPRRGMVNIMASCDGYQSRDKWLTPKLGQSENLRIDLQKITPDAGEISLTTGQTIINTIPGGAKTPADKAPPLSDRLGHYTSDDQILLVKAGADADWQRLASKDFLYANERILALPTYRPEIILGAGVKLRIFGGTELELLPANAREPAGIKIRFGRIIAMPVANAGMRLRIIIGDRSGVITYVDPEAIVAARVRNFTPRASNRKPKQPELLPIFW